MVHNKSAEEFHYRVKQQVQQFHSCVHSYMGRLRHHSIAEPARLSSSSSGMRTAVAVGVGEGNSSASDKGSSNRASGGEKGHFNVQPGDSNFPLWFRSTQM